MAVENPLRSSVNLRVNVGNRQNGEMKLRSIGLGPIVAHADADKIMSVAGALAPVLSDPMFRVERTEVTTIED